MKVLFSADWHLRLGQKNIPVDWATKRFFSLFQQIHELEKQVDIHIIGGDIFDKLPSMEELELYFYFIRDCSIPTYIYDGNHEALKKGTTFLSNLKVVTNLVNPLVKIIDEYTTIDGIDFIPYCKLKDFAVNGFPNSPSRIVCSHFRAEIPPHVKPEINLDLFNQWEVVLAGDLHSYDNCQRNILYPGSPVTTSFHRTHVDTGAILLDTDTLEHSWLKFSLPQLIRKTIKAGEEMIPGTYDHVVYEVEGDMQELGQVADTSLIDKKIVKRQSDTTLILDPEMTVEEELKEYLLYVLTLPENTVEEIIKEYADNANRT